MAEPFSSRFPNDKSFALSQVYGTKVSGLKDGLTEKALVRS